MGDERPRPQELLAAHLRHRRKARPMCCFRKDSIPKRSGSGPIIRYLNRAPTVMNGGRALLCHPRENEDGAASVFIVFFGFTNTVRMAVFR